MKRTVLTLTFLAAGTAALAQSTTQSAMDEDEIVYRPPSAAMANARMGGGSRSEVKLPTVLALVPETLALTASTKPTLFWYCGEDTQLPREFSIIDTETLDTVERVKMTNPIKAGWQKISLAEMKVELKPEMTYEWRVAVIAPTRSRSDNAVAGGILKVSPDAGKDVAGTGVRRGAELASAGVWYDALAAIMAELEVDPQNAAAKKMLAELFVQVKLDEAAKFAAR